MYVLRATLQRSHHLTTQPTVLGAVLAGPLGVRAHTHLVSVIGTVRGGVGTTAIRRAATGYGASTCSGYGAATCSSYGAATCSGYGTTTAWEKKIRVDLVIG